MKHIKQEKLSAFLDGEFTEKERHEIREHLKGCSQCRREAEDLSLVSKLISSVGDVETSPYFVTRLRRRISEDRAAPSLVTRLVGWMEGVRAAPVVLPVGASLLLVISVLVGSHLGNTIHRQQLESAGQWEAQFEESLSLTSFDDFPEGSLGEAYESLYNEGGE